MRYGETRKAARKNEYNSRKKFSLLWQHNFRVAVDRVAYVFGKGSLLVILQNQETCIMQLFAVVLNIILSESKIIFLQAAEFGG